MRLLFDQLAFRTLWPRLLDAVPRSCTRSDGPTLGGLDVGPVGTSCRERGDRDEVRLLFDQLAFRTLWPRLLTPRSGKSLPDLTRSRPQRSEGQLVEQQPHLVAVPRSLHEVRRADVELDVADELQISRLNTR